MPEVEVVEYVSPSEIKPDPDQPRKARSERFIDGLASNILQKGIGIINPIEVDENNLIVTGEMRWRAAQKAGLDKMPVRRVDPPSPEVRFLRQVSENLLQLGAEGDAGTMTPMDVGNSLKRLLKMEEKGVFGKDDVAPSGRNMPQRTPKTVDQGMRRLARRIGMSENFIRNHLNLVDRAKTPKVLADKVESGNVSYSAAREVASVRDPEQRKTIARRVAKQSEKGRVFEATVAAVRRGAEGKAPEEAQEIVEVIEAGKTPGQAERELERIAPTLTQAVDGALKKGQALYDDVHSLQLILRDAGNIEAFPKGQRATVVIELQSLRSDIDDFLGGVDKKYLPVEGANHGSV